MTSFHPYWQGSTDSGDIYYEVAGQRTFSKLQALLWANGDHSQVIYHYLNGIWDRFDWSKEPVESISQLVDRRCQQLRQQYKHVSLWFSGGYDSQTILDSFIRQGLHIDELLTYKRTYFRHWSATAEQDAALRQAQQLKNTTWPNLTVKEIHFTPDLLIDFYRAHGTDWIMQPAFQPSLSKAGRPFLYNHNPAFRQALDTSSRVDIEGREKPRLWIENGWWHAVGLDVAGDCQIASRSTQFYTTSDLPELEIKQAWLMLNWLESLPFSDESELCKFLHALQSHQLGPEIYAEWNLALGRSPVKSIGSYMTVTSGTKMWYSGDITDCLESRDLKEFFLKHYSDVWKTYTNGIQLIKELMPGIFDERNQLRPLISKKYRMKPVEPGRLNHVKA